MTLNTQPHWVGGRQYAKSKVVPQEGLEPPSPCGQQILSLLVKADFGAFQPFLQANDNGKSPQNRGSLPHNCPTLPRRIALKLKRLLGLCPHLSLNHLRTEQGAGEGFHGERIPYIAEHYECRQCGHLLKVRREM